MTRATKSNRSPKSKSHDSAGPAITAANRLVQTPGRRELIVRMYRHGLGDCFLLALPTDNPDHPKYLLIDCGIHARETEGKNRMQQVLENIVAATGSRLDVVVATHEHADHLSGFVQKDSPFLKDSLEVGAVWLGWTEKRGDKQADTLRRKRGTAEAVIRRAVEEARQRAGVAEAPIAEKLIGITDFETPAENSVDLGDVAATIARCSQSNPEALKFLVPTALASPRSTAAAPKNPKGSETNGMANPPSSNELALGLLTAKAPPGNTQYFEPGDVATIPGIKHLRAYVLGPPRENKDQNGDNLLTKSKPSKIRGKSETDPGGMYKEVYLSGGDNSRALALSPSLRIDVETETGVMPDYARHPFFWSFRNPYSKIDEANKIASFQWVKKDAVKLETKDYLTNSYFDPRQDWRRIDGDWLQSAEQLALDLVGDTNNTSLVLAFEWGPPGEGRVLLFPGDAQVGNWLSWRDQEYHADGQTMTADDLLRRTVLYKVGHHGSHNATVRRDSRNASETNPLGDPYGLELMNDIIAMIPIDWNAAQKEMPAVWRMPHRPLYERLREKAKLRVLRSDELLDPLPQNEAQDLVPKDFEWTDVPKLKGARWRRSRETFTKGDTDGPLYYDVAFELED